jgi:hypothetical protein
MSFTGRGMRMHNIGMDCARGGGNRKGTQHRNGLCAGRRESERQNREWQNREWSTTIAVLISSRDSDRPLLVQSDARYIASAPNSEPPHLGYWFSVHSNIL